MDDVIFMGFGRNHGDPMEWSICETEAEWEKYEEPLYPRAHLRACLRIEDYHRLLQLAGMDDTKTHFEVWGDSPDSDELYEETDSYDDAVNAVKELKLLWYLANCKWRILRVTEMPMEVQE